MSIELQLLGRWQVRRDGVPIPVPSRGRVAATLVALALAEGRALTAAELAERLWATDQPANVRDAIATYISRLRKLVGHDEVVFESGRYRLRDRAGVDLLRFRELVASAGRRTDPAAALDGLDDALALWDGEPLAGTALEVIAAAELPALQQQRLSAIERRIDLRMELGEPVLDELARLVLDHPLHERFTAQRMAALYQAGRQSEALDAFRALRERLVDELGVDPGPDVSALHERILQADPALAAKSARSVRPAQLPMSVPDFVGRATEFAALDGLLGMHPDAVVATVIGAAGVGKTSLVVRWAHTVDDRFPDGQLYLNLRAYDTKEPLAPAAALDALLRAVGTPGDGIPDDEDQRAVRWRSAVAGRKTLLLLDNAHDADQIRPLLPGSGCVTVITSRSQLRGLSAHEVATRVVVPRMDDAESGALLAASVGTARLAADPAATNRLVGLGNGLPLVLRILGERIGRFPAASLSSILDDLDDERDRLDALSDGTDRGSGVRSVLSWSLRGLSADAVQVFRQLGVFPGRDLSLPAAAALIGQPVRAARSLLDELVAVHLLEQQQPGRYEFHDLVRVYAAEQADNHLSPGEINEACQRMLDWYLAAAAAATHALAPRSRNEITALVDVPYTPTGPAERSQALDWYRVEFDTIAKLVRFASDHGWHDHCWKLVCAMHLAFDFNRGNAGRLELAEIAIAAARRSDEPVARHRTQRVLAWAYHFAGRYHDAVEISHRALARAEELGEREIVGSLCELIGACHTRLDDPDGAVPYHERAQRYYFELGLDSRAATSLVNLAVCRSHQGNYELAIDHLQAALRIHRENGEWIETGIPLGNLAYVYCQLGEWELAERLCAQALAVMEETGIRYSQSYVFATYGQIMIATNRLIEAEEYLLQARALMAESGDARITVVDELLATVRSGETG